MPSRTVPLANSCRTARLAGGPFLPCPRLATAGRNARRAGVREDRAPDGTNKACRSFAARWCLGDEEQVSQFVPQSGNGGFGRNTNTL